MSNKFFLSALLFLNFFATAHLFSQNCLDTLFLNSNTEILVREHQIVGDELHFYTPEDTLLNVKYTIEQASVKRIAPCAAYSFESKNEQANDEKVKRKRLKYKAFISMKDGNRVNGLLYSLDDYEAIIHNRTSTKRIHLSNIENLKVRRRGKPVKSFLAGTAVGLVSVFAQYTAGINNEDRFFGIPGKREYTRIAVTSIAAATVVSALGFVKINVPLNKKYKRYHAIHQPIRF